MEIAGSTKTMSAIIVATSKPTRRERRVNDPAPIDCRLANPAQSRSFAVAKWVRHSTLQRCSSAYLDLGAKVYASEVCSTVEG